MRSSDEMAIPSPAPAASPRSYRRMYGSGNGDGVDSHRYDRKENEDSKSGRRLERSERSSGYHDEEGVEVVLDRNGNSSSAKVVDSPSRRRQDQNVFRPPHHTGTHRPRAMRATRAHHAMQKSGSYGYGQPSRRSEYGSHRPPMQVPYSHSGSFDENYPPPHPSQTQHYSPPVHYPTPGAGYQSGDVNVISPNHKPDPYGPPATPRSRHPRSQHYQYPPTSPVSRPGAEHSNSPPRKHYGMRRTEGPYAAAQRDGHSYHPDDGTFNHYQPSSSSGDRPPLVTESSFDSENYPTSHYSPHQSYPSTQGGHREANSQFYGGGSFGSFETAPPPHFDDYRYYGYKSESPYSSHYSPGQPYYGEHYPSHHPYDRPHYEEGEYRGMRDYHDSDIPPNVTPNDKKHGSPDSIEEGQGKTVNGIMLPKAASEIDFEVTSPPAEPVVSPSEHPLCDSPAAINSHDVLCGRGGGTNSQIGNRRFRQLVQEFQPTYLLARRKEKPLLARTIVLIIRKRGGRFLKKDDETGELYEVGDSKAEAKTSQALREGLDVRATKSAANSLVDKKKKKKKGTTKESEKEEPKEEKDEVNSKNPKEENRAKTPPRDVVKDGSKSPPSSPPPSLPRLQQDIKAGVVHPHSPEAIQFRKRRRMRSGGCGAVEDKLFPDFCPPRADLQRSASPFPDDDDDHLEMASTPPHRNMRHPEDEHFSQGGCAGIAMSIMTGAATGSFCLGPNNWRKK